MSTIDKIIEQYNVIQAAGNGKLLGHVEQKAFENFNKLGIPGKKHEEWKYTPIQSVFNHEFEFDSLDSFASVSQEEFQPFRLPGYEDANELVFVNGIFAESLSSIRSENLLVMPLEQAMQKGYAEIINNNLGYSNRYINDGVQALNEAFIHHGIFIYLNKSYEYEQPIYIYHITDARKANRLSLPRNLFYVCERTQVQIAETYNTLGTAESFTNHVLEIIMEKDSIVDYYKIQKDASHCNLVSTTHFRQLGKSVMNAVTVSLDGDLIRNNLNIAMDAEYAEAHLYGLYFLHGKTHVDNHTVVDNMKPNCLSNELYKGVMDGESTAVFNGKIFVQPDAQQINAFQSNKNILLSDKASVNTKPQLEIFADNVKCSHGCTVGQLDEEGLFYLRARGINEKTAKSLLIHAYIIDILDKIKLETIREHIDQLISDRLEFELS